MFDVIRDDFNSCQGKKKTAISIQKEKVWTDLKIKKQEQMTSNILALLRFYPTFFLDIIFYNTAVRGMLG